MTDPSDHPRRLLRCQAGDRSFLIDRRWIRSIHAGGSLHPAAEPGPQVGSLHTGAGDIPVFSLASLLGSAEGRARSQHIIAFAASWGLLVDGIGEDVQVDAKELRPLPSCLRHLEFIDAVYHHGADMAFVLFPPGLAPVAAAPGTEQRSFAAYEGPLPAPSAPAPRRAADRELVVCSLGPPLPLRRALALGFSARQVNEVVVPGTILPVPHAPEHLVGVTVWRDWVIPVIDLMEKRNGDSPGNGSAPRLVVAQAGRSLEPAGFLVRPPIRVLNLPVPHMALDRDLAVDRKQFRGVFEIPNETVLVPDLDRLTASAASPEACLSQMKRSDVCPAER